MQKLALDLLRQDADNRTIRFQVYGMNVKVVVAEHGHREAIDACLTEMSKRDLFLSRHQFSDFKQNAWVALVEDEVAGIGWVRPKSTGHTLDVRVLPRFRRQGIGCALFSAITQNLDGPVFASCDPAQGAALKFLEARRFEIHGAVYAQRWDGDVSDVPRAFRSAQIEETDDSELVDDIFRRAYGDHWLRPTLSTQTQVDQAKHWRVARIDGEAVGAIVAHRARDVRLAVGLGTVPDARRFGVGRALLCDLMTYAAEKNMGVLAQIEAGDALTNEWCQRLGFWTYRTWLYFNRSSTPAPH